MADTYGKQPIRTTDSGDVEVGVLDASNNRVDPRAIRALTSSDTVTAVQSTAANLKVAVSDSSGTAISTSNPLSTDIIVSGAAIDPRSIRALTSSDTVTAAQSTAANLKTAISDSSGTAISSTNGLYVVPTTGAVWNVVITGGATTIPDYDGSVAAGNGGAAVNHDYTNSTGSTVRINSVVISATTSSSYYVQIDPTGSAGYTTKWVGFVSESMPSFVIDTSDDHLANGGKIRIIKTNTAKAATSYSLHSTINMDY